MSKEKPTTVVENENRRGQISRATKYPVTSQAKQVPISLKPTDNRQYFWDTAQDTREVNRYEAPNDQKWTRVYIGITVIVRIILCLVVLGSAVISKLCFVLIVTNISPPMGQSNLTTPTSNNSDLTSLTHMPNNCNLTSALLTQKIDYDSTLEYYWRKTAGFSIRYKSTEIDVQWIWAMFLIIIAPYFFTLTSAAWLWATGKTNPKTGWEGFIWVMLFETLDSIGLCFMAFVLLPNIDPIAVILFCFNIAFTSGAIGICCTPRLLWSRVVNIIGFVLQLASIGFACSYYALENKSKVNDLHPLLFLVVNIFVSFNWWQNPPKLESNVNEKDQHRCKIYSLVGAISDRRSKYSVIVSCWKITITFIFPLTLFGASCVEGEKCIQTLFGLNKNASTNSAFGHTLLMSKTTFGPCHYNLPMVTAAVGIICSGLCYRAVKLGFNIVAHVPCVAVPLVLSIPVAVAALVWILGRDTCYVCDLPYPHWSNDVPFVSEYLKTSFYWMVIVSGLCGYASFIIINLDIWKPRNVRLQTAEELNWCSLLFLGSKFRNWICFIDKLLYHMASVMLRFIYQYFIDRICLNIFVTDMSFTDSMTAMKYISKQTPRIYICVTMWHETKSEMKKLMQSILRLDTDHDKSKQFRTIVGDYNDFFTFEVHIMFDDAFRIENDPEKDEAFELNEYVKNFIDVVNETTNNEDSLEEKTKTIYGGKLTWKVDLDLPFGSKMTAHLKNKSKISAKKRWSQIMDFKNEALLPFQNKSANKIRTFLLKRLCCSTLDGDVDFRPEAVKYLMDRMRKDPKVGAACGRIHPTGNGPIVWYQKFEYAISHWQQKATEDMLGCVLCSPGCFSLFRGSALLDDNVMNVYTTRPTEENHHVRYDQGTNPAHSNQTSLDKVLTFWQKLTGEDRWLCTLLLQQGYKIEYVAASDAFTEAPEKFKEIFNQRRRWSPSTMANILNLIWDWKHVVKTNPNISVGYILYQVVYMISAILVPATTVLMMVDALSTAFPELKPWVALLLNIIPIIIFIVLCFKSSCEMQMKFGVILSIAYSLQMMIVIVGLAIRIGDYGHCSIITIFLTFVAGVFIIAAVLHPQEISCIIHGFTCFIALPTASIVMYLYSLCNLNVTSWGTRESSKHSSTENRQSLPGSIPNWLGLRCSCCASEPTAEEFSRQEQNDNVKQQIEPVKNETTINEESFQEHAGSQKSRKGKWMRDKMLNAAKKTKSEKREKKFWKRVIRKYLYPLNPTEEENETISTSLTTLRNKVCMLFFVINAMFILVVFTLQQVASQKKTLTILTPLTPMCRIEAGPVSVAFTVVFGILLLLQFVCMLVHRFGTLIHICARTSLFELNDPIQENKTLYEDLCKKSHDDKPGSSKNQVSPIGTTHSTNGESV